MNERKDAGVGRRVRQHETGADYFYETTSHPGNKGGTIASEVTFFFNLNLLTHIFAPSCWR